MASAPTSQIVIPTPHIITSAANLDLNKPGKLAGEIEADAYQVVASWINSILHVDAVSPNILRTVVSSAPGLGQILAAYDLVVDVKELASRNEAENKWGYELIPNWLTLSLDLVGFAPGIGGTIKGFKPALSMICSKRGSYELVRQHLVAIGMGAAMTKLEEIADTEMDKWHPAFSAQFVKVIDGFQGSLHHMANSSRAVRVAQNMAHWLGVTDPVKAVDKLLGDTKGAGPEFLRYAILGGRGFPGLKTLVLNFFHHGKIQVPAGKPGSSGKPDKGTKTPHHTQEDQSKERSRPAATGKTNEHLHESNEQVASRNKRILGEQQGEAPGDCCPKNKAGKTKAAKTGRPVHIATGQEILYQTDFAVPGLIPVDFTRCYRSSHAAYDSGLLGARWTSPYTTAITQTADGLIYHDATGRNVKLPLVDIGQEHDVPFESFTLKRDDATTLTLVYRNGDTDIFRSDGPQPPDTQGRRTQRYALRAQHSKAGPTLHILPALEARHRFRHLPAAHSLDPQALLVITDAHQLWLECLPADADHIDSEDPGTPKAAAPLAALHDANHRAGLAHLAGEQAHLAHWQAHLARKIGRIVQLLPDGTRHTHVSYRYRPAFDANGQLLSAEPDLAEQRDAQGHARRYTYASDVGPHLLTRYTGYNGFGQNLQWQHNPDWAPFPVRCIRTVADDGTEETRLTYRPERFETEVATPDGVRCIYQYNRHNLIVAVLTLRDDDTHLLEQQIWDERGNLIKEIDPQGRTTRYTYDERGNVLTVGDPTGAVTRYEYDAANNPIAVTDPAGNLWKNSYDERGNQTAQTDPAGHTTAYTYDERGRLTAIQDPKGGLNKLAYNEQGQLVAVTDCSHKTTRYSYNSLGHLIAGTDAAGHVTRYDTDRLGRIASMTRPDGSKEHYQYDPDGHLTAVTDANGKTTRYGYRPQGQLTERIDANGHRLAYRYNAALQLIQLTNQNGDTCDFRYDQQGKLIEETGFDGKTTAYRYDDGGRLIQSHSGSIRIDYQRDDSGKLLEKRLHRPTPAGPETSKIRYQYDILGQLVRVQSKHGHIRFAYNDTGHLIEETQHLRLKQGAKTIERIFTLKHDLDPLGNRIQTTLPNGRKVGTQRYGSGHWIGTLWNGQPIADLERDELHREKARQLGRTPNPQQRLMQTKRYDPLSRLAGQRLQQGRGELLAARHYQYDPVGNLTQIEDSHRDKIGYRYDPLGQLLNATQAHLSETFAFDPAGNLTDGTPQTKGKLANTQGKDHDTWQEGLDHLTEQPQGETRPQLAPVTRNLLKHYLNQSFDYDAQGNTIRKIVKGKANEQPQTLSLHYDAENRLVKVIKPQAGHTIEAEYAYDAFGRRIAKIVRTRKQAQATGTWGFSLNNNDILGEAVTFFVWDGDNLIQEIQPDKTITYLYEPESFVPLAQVHSATPDSEYEPEQVHKKQSQEEAKAQEQEDEADKLKWLRVTDAKAYTLTVQTINERKQRQWEEEFLKLEQEAQSDCIYFIHADHLGTPQEVVSEDGRIVWLARYKAWGRIHALDKSEIKQPLRFQGQYEDEETGLFYNRHRYYDPDTARYLTQDPIGLVGGENIYQYVPNPLAWADPLGLTKKSNCDLSLKKEKELEAGSFEQARNLALQKLGPIVPGSRVTQIGRLGVGKDQKVGFYGVGPDGTFKRYRLDYDPVKQAHINVEIGKGACAEKYAIKFPGNEETIRKLYQRNT